MREIIENQKYANGKKIKFENADLSNFNRSNFKSSET